MRKRGNHSYQATYKNIREIIKRNYGKIHLCGNCEHFESCVRFKIQSTKNKMKKERLMHINAPFVTKFSIDKLSESINDIGFITVYECTKFEFEDLGGTNEILLQQKQV